MNRRTLLAAVPATLALTVLGATAAEAHPKNELFPGLTKVLRKIARQQRKGMK